MKLDFKNIDEKTIIDYIREGTDGSIFVTSFTDYGVFQEIEYIQNNIKEKSLVKIKEEIFISFLRRRKINKILGKDEQHITENTHF